jgi:hypothetical protein
VHWKPLPHDDQDNLGAELLGEADIGGLTEVADELGTADVEGLVVGVAPLLPLLHAAERARRTARAGRRRTCSV